MAQPVLLLYRPIKVGFTNQGLDFDDALDYAFEKEEKMQEEKLCRKVNGGYL